MLSSCWEAAFSHVAACVACMQSTKVRAALHTGVATDDVLVEEVMNPKPVLLQENMSIK